MKFLSLFKRFYNPYKKAVANGLQTGTGVSVMSGVNFGSEPWLITLGDYVRISFDVAFITHDGGTWAFRDLPEYKDVIRYGTISIGDHTFIGARSIIMPGVNIGSRCVIGAGSIVTRNIPDGMVAVGAPARVVRTTKEYAEKLLLECPPYDKDSYDKNKRKEILRVLDNCKNDLDNKSST